MHWLFIISALLRAKALGDFLNFDSVIFVFNIQDGLILNFIVSVRDSNNALVEVNSLEIYISRDPSGTTEYSGWRIRTVDGVASGRIHIYCIGIFNIVADSPGYASTRSISMNRMSDNECFPIYLTASPLVVSIDELISITAIVTYDTVSLIPGSSFELIEVYGSSISGTSMFGSNIGSINTQITFSTQGTKKILAVFHEYYAYAFSIDVCDNYIKITFPNEYVILI